MVLFGKLPYDRTSDKTVTIRKQGGPGMLEVLLEIPFAGASEDRRPKAGSRAKRSEGPEENLQRPAGPPE